MLGKPIRKRILEGKLLDQVNPYQDLKKIRDRSNLAIRDLALVAKKLDEKQLEGIFTKEKIDPLLDALLKPRNKRTILIAETMAEAVYQKLILELPNSIVNSLGGDIGKTWVYAKLLSEHYDKPLKKVSRSK